ncbi:MAG: RecX family transcriptional regulator [Nitrospirota bacterium]
MKDFHDKDIDIVHKARQYALKLLSYRGRSEKELKERLIKKGITKSVASSTINYLKHVGLIDDKALAETLKREALTTKLLSQNGAKRFMLNRGIPREFVNMILSHDENEDIENARRLVEKKLKAYKNYSSETVKRRLHNLLLRRGYSFETIKRVLNYKIEEEI